MVCDLSTPSIAYDNFEGRWGKESEIAGRTGDLAQGATMSPVIEVLVSPSGETQIETRGFAGPACQQATKALEAALGLKQ